MKEEDIQNKTATIEFYYSDEGITKVPVKLRFLSGELLTEISKYDIDYQKALKVRGKKQEELKNSDVFAGIDMDFLISLENKDLSELSTADQEKVLIEYNKLDDEKLTILNSFKNEQKVFQNEWQIKYFLIITYPINSENRNLWSSKNIDIWHNKVDIEEVELVNYFFRSIYKKRI